MDFDREFAEIAEQLMSDPASRMLDSFMDVVREWAESERAQGRPVTPHSIFHGMQQAPWTKLRQPLLILLAAAVHRLMEEGK